jgi:hypothetical protein
MCKLSALLPLFCLIAGTLYAQSPETFGDRLMVGTSMTYRGGRQMDIPNRYHELTWSKNIAVNLTRHLYLGLDYRSLWTQGSAYTFSEQQQRYFMVGSFVQFDLLPNDPLRLFLEVSSYYGNYYDPIGLQDPYRQDGLWYFGGGGGLDIPLNRYLSLDLAFIFHDTYGTWRETTGYNIYIIGLNVNLGLR